MLGRTLAIVALAALLVLPVASAQDQQRITTTSLTADGEEAQSTWQDGIKAGEGASVFVNLNYCHGGPGLNPNAGQVTAEIAMTAPEWMTLIPPEAVTWTPPATHTSQEEECYPEKVEVPFTIANTATPGEQGKIDVVITVTEDANLAQSTYQSVAGEYTTDINIAVKEPEVDPVTGQVPGQEDNGTADPNVDNTAEESPAPLPVVGILAMVGLAALRRRRD